MQILLAVVVLVLSYLIGSIPFGVIIVRLKTGEDLRQVASGRTGGTNAIRAAGFWVGMVVTVLDGAKAACAVWLASSVVQGDVWLEVLAPVAAVFGHNYSIFLAQRDESGIVKLGGGAGGASTVGGAFGLYPASILIILPMGLFIWFGIGYASLATMSVALASIIVFGIFAALGITPWQYIIYGVLTEIILLWALRPNIRRLLDGTERLIGWRARRQKKRETEEPLQQIDQSSNSSS